MLGEFFVVVEEAERTEPQSRHEHQEHVDVRQVAHEQAGHDDGEDYDYTAHGGSAGFLGLALEVEIAHNLTHLHQLQALDNAFSHENRQEHGKDKCHARTERKVGHQTCAGHVEVL